MVAHLKKVIELIDRQIEFTEKQIIEEQRAYQCPFYSQVAKHRTLQWTGSITDCVELVYALHASGALGSGNISLTQLFQTAGTLFEVEIKDFSRTFSDIKNRVRGDRTAFLDRMKQALTAMDRPSKKRFHLKMFLLNPNRK